MERQLEVSCIICGQTDKVEKWHAEYVKGPDVAKASGTKIVHFCNFCLVKVQAEHWKELFSHHR